MKEKKAGNITIEALYPAYGGISIGRVEGRVVLIRGAIPGETVEARVDATKKDYIEATTVRVLSPSPDRVTPESPYFARCGGCQLQHIAYERQVLLKEEVLKSTLRRIGGIEAGLSPSVTGAPFGYRRRGQFKLAYGRAGFFRERSREVVDIAHCSLMTEEVNGYFSKAKALLIEKWKGAGIRELHISAGDDGVLALVKTARGAEADWDALARGLMGLGFSGVLIEDGAHTRGYGAEYVTLGLAGLRYTVSPKSFFQSNWSLNQEVVRLAIEGLQPLEGRRVLDLYSGAGNFSLPIAGHALEVVAVEENPDAVEDGERNLRLNGVQNMRLVRSRADSPDLEFHADVVVADPPRTGLGPGVAERLLDLSPEKVLYVSCDPATLARDLKKLSAGYELESVRMVDFFPQTYHIESLTFLTRRH